MNVYLGVDWSQMKHDLCWMNEAGAVVAQQTILHSVEGFAKLDEARQRLGIAPDACLVGIETAHSLLIDFLWARGYTQVYVMAPGMINSTRGRYRQSGAKNDTSDARVRATASLPMSFAPIERDSWLGILTARWCNRCGPKSG